MSPDSELSMGVTCGTQVEKCSKARSNGGRVLAHECFSLGYFRNWTTLAKVAQTVLNIGISTYLCPVEIFSFSHMFSQKS